MALMIHQDHTIVSTPVYDENSGQWKFTVSISWRQSGGSREVHFLTSSPELFVRFEDAEQAGLEAGKNWVETNCRT